jgi:sulfatase maturation enzyme AslB (radical SAM superfamily)
MKKIIKIENNHDPKMLRVEWTIGNVCNYRCHYCFPGSHEGDMPWPEGENVELLKKNFTHLFDHYLANGRETIQFYMLGGETTLWKHLPEFVAHFKNRYQDKIIINMATNGYRKVHWWEKNAKYFDHIEISVHNEFCDPDHIMEVADYLFHTENMVVANVLMDPKAFDKCKDIVDKFLAESKYDWPIIVKALHFDGVMSYPPDQAEYFKPARKRMPSIEKIKKFYKGKLQENRNWVTFEDGEVLEVPTERWFALNHLNRFTGWSCNLGVEIVKVAGNGSLSGNCWQKLYGLNDYFSIFDPEFVEKYSPEIKPVICRQLICPCTSEIKMNKHKIVKEQSLILEDQSLLDSPL